MSTEKILPGTILEGGRYTILGEVGQGNMGEVFRALDDRLGTEVVIKLPLKRAGGADLVEAIERFEREIRSLILLSHPHVVKVIDVGRHEGQPYVVMQYLEGGSLKDRTLDVDGKTVPMDPLTLSGWLPDIAKALDFIHSQGFVHRDVKPANILFDVHGNAYLGDFGIMKALGSAGDQNQSAANSLTAPGFLLGTPNYVAPEIVMGGPPGPRVDQYSLAMTLHEVLSGKNPMAGPTPSATIVNQLNRMPAPLVFEAPGVPLRFSEAVHKALSKDPADRYESCLAFARDAIADFGTGSGSDLLQVFMNPGMGDVAPTAGETLVVPRPSVAEAQSVGDATPVKDDLRQRSGTFAEVPAQAVPAHRSRWSRRKAALFAVAAVGLGFAGFVIANGDRERRSKDSSPQALPAATLVPKPITINIVYGSEKQAWLEAALIDFQKEPEGRGIVVHMTSTGSVEGARMALEADENRPIHVWSPASSTYRDVFERDWRLKHPGGSPIASVQNLAYTPMVFIIWKARYDPFLEKYGKVCFKTLAEAAKDPGGWGSIAGKPEWGAFRFGHTDPDRSNSGLLTLILMAYDFAGRSNNLLLSDVESPEFRAWLTDFERGVARHGQGLTSSSGTLMREMILRGPSQYDALMLYENLALDALDQARDHWGELFICYADPNLWNDHPYYLLNTPWTTKDEQAAAEKFLAFLLSEPMQRKALMHGFRPGNPVVPVRGPGSPLLKAEPNGVRFEIPPIAEPPRAEVVDGLLKSFRQIHKKALKT